MKDAPMILLLQPHDEEIQVKAGDPWFRMISHSQKPGLIQSLPYCEFHEVLLKETSGRVGKVIVGLDALKHYTIEQLNDGFWVAPSRGKCTLSALGGCVETDKSVVET
nr:hypothetical protein Iba_chr01bCG7230 [Ipomoea batatas]